MNINKWIPMTVLILLSFSLQWENSFWIGGVIDVHWWWARTRLFVTSTSIVFHCEQFDGGWRRIFLLCFVPRSHLTRSLLFLPLVRFDFWVYCTLYIYSIEQPALMLDRLMSKRQISMYSFGLDSNVFERLDSGIILRFEMQFIFGSIFTIDLSNRMLAY